MAPEKHALLKTLPPPTVTALYSIAFASKLAVHHLVDAILGNIVYPRYPKSALDAAVGALTEEQRAQVGSLRDQWTPDPEPAWLVLVVGGRPKDDARLTALLREHFRSVDLPLRVELRPGKAWVVARYMGTMDDVRDVPIDPGTRAQIEAWIDYPEPSPIMIPVEEEELAQALHEAERELAERLAGPGRFREWHEISKPSRDNHLFVAKTLLEKFVIQRRELPGHPASGK